MFLRNWERAKNMTKFYVKKGFYQFIYEGVFESSQSEDRLETRAYEDSIEMYHDQNPESEHDEEYEGCSYGEKLEDELEVTVEEFDATNSRHTLVEEHNEELNEFMYYK